MGFKKETAKDTTALATETVKPTDGGNLPNLDGNALADHAKALGAKVTEEIEGVISLVSKAKEDWQGGPFPVLFALRETFDDDDLDGFAVPDSDTGNNPDDFKISKENAKGKTTLSAYSFYRGFAEGTPAGQNYLARIEFCERMADDKAMKDDVPDDIRSMNPHELENHAKWCGNRLRTMQSAYKSAMALYFKEKEVSAYPGITCEPQWVPGKEGKEVQNIPEPIAVWVTPEAGKPVMKWKSFTIKAFLRLNVRKALEKGGTFLSLVESGVTPKTAGTGATTNNPADGLVIKTLEKGVSVLAEFHRWSDEIHGAKDQQEYGKLLKLMNAKDNDELIAAWVETVNFMTDVAKATGAFAKYTALQSGGSELVQQTAKAA